MTVPTGLIGRFRFGCRRAARILSFDFDLCSIHSIRSILPFDNICLSIRRGSSAIQAAYSAGQSCRSDAHRRCRTLHREAKGEAKCTNNPMCLLCITSFPTTPLVITSPSSCHGYLVTEHAMAKPCSGDSGGPHSNVNSSSPVFPNLRTEAKQIDRQR